MKNIAQHFIGGRRVDPEGPSVFEVRSPFDGSLVGTVPEATPSDIDRAVKQARIAFDTGPWPRMSPEERQQVLRKFADLHSMRGEEIAALISRENGTPISVAIAL